ncbi:transporter substrate-binding domain-containing protein [Sulfurospirillum sp. T05]|uniref:Transporter substrate-binding domain-containing protein n=1 Tax=Sulfurospirillum tamanense TaxID=2813362 RepID=A0ABS2WPB7_9BACT|nr:transporter substrate-binding domain-containing protein [Sulfurospirillum tamanensis]MBN2963537.1 transporter substrate-binding domain-containing protein [Sulfurospirillum tamanensis]
MRFILFLLFFGGVAFGTALSQDERAYLVKRAPITLCVDPDWEPFEMLDESGVYTGIGADLIALVQERLGIKLHIVPTRTWEESIAFSKQGKCDVLSFLNQTSEREAWLSFTKPLFSDPNVLIGRIEQGYIDDISKISASVALIKETSIYEWFSSSFPNLTVVPVASEAEAFRLIEERKADLTLRSMIVAAHTIKKQGLFNLKIVGQPKGFENHLRMGVRKDEPILRAILDKAIATITQEERQAIVNRHVQIIVERVTYLSAGLWVVLGLLAVTLLVFLWNWLLQKKINKAVAKNLAQQELLFQKNRQAELVDVVANISHQWRDSLSHISSLNLLLKTKLMLDKEIKSEELVLHVQAMENSVDFMADTMRNFLDFYKNTKEIVLFDAKDSIEATLAIIDTRLKEAKAVVVLTQESPVVLEGVRNDWMHVWLNCITNSLCAGAKRDIQSPTLEIHIAPEGVSIRDNCGGFDAVVLAQIADQTQEGLGLKMSGRLVEKYGWKMRLSNENWGALVVFSRL